MILWPKSPEPTRIGAFDQLTTTVARYLTGAWRFGSRWRGLTSATTLDFEVLVVRIVFDRNSRVRFDEPMIQAVVKKSVVHGVVHVLRRNIYQVSIEMP